MKTSFEFDDLHETFGKASQVEGIAHIIRHGEELANIQLPDDNNPYIPIVTEESMADENKMFRGLTPASKAVLASAAGFLTLGRADRGLPTHLMTVLREFKDREGFLALACDLTPCDWTMDEVYDMKEDLNQWDGKRVRISKATGLVTLELIPT